jgi:hypothetical protein
MYIIYKAKGNAKRHNFSQPTCSNLDLYYMKHVYEETKKGDMMVHGVG